MKVTFREGPWDGVGADLPTFPKEISFRDLEVGRTPKDGGGVTMHVGQRWHWRYRFVSLSEDEFYYHYAPTEGGEPKSISDLL